MPYLWCASCIRIALPCLALNSESDNTAFLVTILAKLGVEVIRSSKQGAGGGGLVGPCAHTQVYPGNPYVTADEEKAVVNNVS